MTEDRFRVLRREIARWIEEQDADLILSTAAPVEVLIASLTDADLEQDEAGLVRSALLVRRYDLKRKGQSESPDAKLIESWFEQSFPEGVSKSYPYQYLLDEPEKT